MSSPRRRLIRLHQPPPDQPLDRQIQRLRSRLETQRLALHRWMARLKRAFHYVEKIQRRIHRIERQLARLENTP